MISREAYIRWHALRAFFESYESWLACRGWVGLTDEIPRDTYQRLLMGTDADCYVPLWASACLSGEDVLLNETTLAVIAAYKKWGYQWVDMDGNPPDYIGQQCRFMEYLCVCGLKTGDEALEQAGQEFCDRFLLGTAHRVAEAARENDLGEAVEKVLALLKEAAALAPARVQDPGGALPFDSTQWERGPQLELEPPRVVGHASFCDCGNKCRMLSTVQEGCVLSILPDKDFMGKSFSGCPRGMAYRQTFLNSRRLRYPMVRTGRRGEGKFRRISWPEAETLVAEAVRDSRERFGPASRYVMAAAGVCALMRPDRCMKHLLSCDGGYLDFYNFYSAACAEHVLPYIYGTVACGSPERQLLQSKLLLLWGHNPVDTHFGDNHTELFVQAKGSGIRVIVIDPRCSDTARLFADQWIPIRPSTDGALADAMAYVIWSRGLQDQAFMDTYCLGFDEDHMPPGVPPGESYHSYLFGRKDHVEKTPEWAAAITGVPATITPDEICVPLIPRSNLPELDQHPNEKLKTHNRPGQPVLWRGHGSQRPDSHRGNAFSPRSNERFGPGRPHRLQPRTFPRFPESSGNACESTGQLHGSGHASPQTGPEPASADLYGQLRGERVRGDRARGPEAAGDVQRAGSGERRGQADDFLAEGRASGCGERREA